MKNFLKILNEEKNFTFVGKETSKNKNPLKFTDFNKSKDFANLTDDELEEIEMKMKNGEIEIYSKKEFVEKIKKYYISHREGELKRLLDKIKEIDIFEKSDTDYNNDNPTAKDYYFRFKFSAEDRNIREQEFEQKAKNILDEFGKWIIARDSSSGTPFFKFKNKFGKFRMFLKYFGPTQTLTGRLHEIGFIYFLTKLKETNYGKVFEELTTPDKLIKILQIDKVTNKLLDKIEGLKQLDKKTFTTILANARMCALGFTDKLKLVDVGKIYSVKWTGLYNSSEEVADVIVNNNINVSLKYVKGQLKNPGWKSTNEIFSFITSKNIENSNEEFNIRKMIYNDNNDSWKQILENIKKLKFYQKFSDESRNKLNKITDWNSQVFTINKDGEAKRQTILTDIDYDGSIFEGTFDEIIASVINKDSEAKKQFSTIRDEIVTILSNVFGKFLDKELEPEILDTFKNKSLRNLFSIGKSPFYLVYFNRASVDTSFNRKNMKIFQFPSEEDVQKLIDKIDFSYETIKDKMNYKVKLILKMPDEKGKLETVLEASYVFRWKARITFSGPVEIGTEITKENFEKIFNENKIMNKSLKLEGGNAVSGVTRIAYDEVGPTLEQINLLIKNIGLDPNKTVPLGSIGKKESSGDIDIGVSIEEVIEKFGQGTVPELIVKINEKIKSKVKESNLVGKGLGVLSFSFPIYNNSGPTDKLIQVDFMIGPLKFLKEYYASGWEKSDKFNVEDKLKTKYKGVYRNILLFSILIALRNKIDEHSFEQYILSPGEGAGIFKVLKSFIGKSGKPVKKAQELKREFITQDFLPFFGELLQVKIDKEEVSTFENLWFIVLKSPVAKKVINKIVDEFAASLEKIQLPIPSEISSVFRR